MNAVPLHHFCSFYNIKLAKICLFARCVFVCVSLTYKFHLNWVLELWCFVSVFLPRLPRGHLFLISFLVRWFNFYLHLLAISYIHMYVSPPCATLEFNVYIIIAIRIYFGIVQCSFYWNGINAHWIHERTKRLFACSLVH